MAIDEALASFVRKAISPPTLRLYGWERPSLSLGRFQRIHDINVPYCMANNIPVVRRPTGGRAILHDNELTYSFSVRIDIEPFSRGLFDSYMEISKALMLSFKKIGVQAEAKMKKEKGRILSQSPLCFQTSSLGEILVGNRKMVGSAQKRWSDGLLQQGSIPYLYNEEKIRGIFGIKRAAVLNECMKAVKEDMPELKEDEFKKIISASFEEYFGIKLLPSVPSQEELLLARWLETRKYLPVAEYHTDDCLKHCW